MNVQPYDKKLDTRPLSAASPRHSPDTTPHSARLLAPALPEPLPIMPMDAKEVESHGRAITKAQAAGEPGSSLIKLLDDLRTGVQATEDLLRSTKIGIIVNKLKTSKDPNVAKKASELVSKWRADVKKAGADRSSTPKQQNGTQSPASQAAASPAPVAKPKPKHNVPLDKRSVDTDGVDWRLTGNATRDNCLKMMYNALALNVEDGMSHYHTCMAVG